MLEVLLFGEDVGHEIVLRVLVQRLALECGTEVTIRVRRARGGHGLLQKELRTFTREFEQQTQPMPDLLVIGRDANCHGYATVKQGLEETLSSYPGPHVAAVPDPHIERWLLLDSAAFKSVLGQGCSPPDQKCEKDRYKILLGDAIRNAGLVPIIGGIEHAEDLVNAMNLQRVEKADDSLRHFLRDLRAQFHRWQ